MNAGVSLDELEGNLFCSDFGFELLLARDCGGKTFESFGCFHDVGLGFCC